MDTIFSLCCATRTTEELSNGQNSEPAKIIQTRQGLVRILKWF